VALAFCLAPASALAEDGAASPKEAAEGLLAAWKAKDKAAFRGFIREADREEAEVLLDCTEVKSYAVGEVTEKDGETHAKYTWDVTLDADKFGAAIMASARKEAEASGAKPEEIEAQMGMMQAMLPGLLPIFKSHFEKKEHSMVLVKDGERWFVDKPLEEPSEGPDGGGN
jgi:hypothetical protein